MKEKVTRLFGQVDMTEGQPWKKIVIFTLPMLIGNVAQQLYNTVDTIVVGKYIGDEALGAVGSAGAILICCWCCLWVLPWAQASWYPSILAPGTGRICQKLLVLPLH